MTSTLKFKLTIAALVVAGLAFLEGMSLLCYCPGPFMFALPFACAAILLGPRWSLRVIGICLCAASIAMAVHQFHRKQHLDAIIRAAQAHATTNSISK